MSRLWHTPRLLNALANALILLSLLGLLCAAGWWLGQRPGLALRVVRIDAAPGTELRHVSAVLLDQSVRQRLRGNFFTVDLDAVRAGFEQVPWVRRAMVRRVWPDRLEVAIEEHRPLARSPYPNGVTGLDVTSDFRASKPDVAGIERERCVSRTDGEAEVPLPVGANQPIHKHRTAVHGH